MENIFSKDISFCRSNYSPFELNLAKKSPFFSLSTSSYISAASSSGFDSLNDNTFDNCHSYSKSYSENPFSYNHHHHHHHHYNNNNQFSNTLSLEENSSNFIDIDTNKPKSQSLDSLMDSEVFTENVEFFDTNSTVNYDQNNQQLIQSNFFTSDILQQQHQPNITPSSFYSSFKASNHLWQFLLELLEDKRASSIIRWTSTNPSSYICSSFNNISNNNNSNQVNLPSSTKVPLNRTNSSTSTSEFVILDPKEVARRWAARNNKMNQFYKKFCRTLRYYYNNKKILQKIAGKRDSYCFLINIDPYLIELRNQNNQMEQQQRLIQMQQQQQQQLFLVNQASSLNTGFNSTIVPSSNNYFFGQH